MKRLSGFLLPLLIAVMLSSCVVALYAMGGQSWFEHNDSGKEALVKRASFDLECAADQIQFTGLGKNGHEYESVGVSGCNKKAVYLYVFGHNTAGRWVLNTDATKAR